MVKIPTMRCQHCDARRIVLVFPGEDAVQFFNGASLIDSADVIPTCSRCHEPMATEAKYQEWLAQMGTMH